MAPLDMLACSEEVCTCDPVTEGRRRGERERVRERRGGGGKGIERHMLTPTMCNYEMSGERVNTHNMCMEYMFVKGRHE